MKALRKDLLDRRLWPLVALLIAAVVAVPVLALNHASNTPATAAPSPQGPTAAAEAGAAKGAAADRHEPAATGPVHDPFAAGAALASTTTASSSAASSAAAAPTVTTATPATVSPAPVAASAAPATSTRGPGSGSSAPTTPSTVAAKPVSSPDKPGHRSVSAEAQPRAIYAVDVRFGHDASAPVRRDLARLTPLPSATQPVAMYLGVLAGGEDAVFEMNSSVQHAGPGVCRPSRKVCSAIMLRAGQTETLTVPVAGGAQKQLSLRVVDIRSRVTRSFAEAFAAYERHSAAGLCDLALADPMAYSLVGGTLTGIAGAACTNHPDAVPFPSAVESR